MSDLRRWRYADVAWGATYCEIPRCFDVADYLYEYERGAGVPVCADHAQALLERAEAAGRMPRGLGLPELWEQPRPWQPPRDDPADWDRSPEKWLAEQLGKDTADPDWDIPF